MLNMDNKYVVCCGPTARREEQKQMSRFYSPVQYCEQWMLVLCVTMCRLNGVTPLLLLQ